MGRLKGVPNKYSLPTLGTFRPRKKIAFRVEGECFICTSHAISLQGYPVVRKYGKLITVSKHIYEECFGEVPKGQHIRHTCDNQLCINPEHLILGSHTDNMHDMIARGRAKHPSMKGVHKLSDEEVLAIRARNESNLDCMKKYGIALRTVIYIRTGKTHKDLL